MSGPYPRIAASAVPTVTADQMRAVDAHATGEIRLDLLQMMENAGRSLAELAIERFGPETVVVAVGGGNNGGGGLAAARHLANRGVDVSVVLSHEETKMRPAPRHQLYVAARMGIPVVLDPPDADLLVDALIGYSLTGDPRGAYAEAIRWMNVSDRPILSLDLPSGLDPDGGGPRRPCVKADATLALALPKRGEVDAPEVGELYLADISIPRIVYAELGIDVPVLFDGSAIVALV